MAVYLAKGKRGIVSIEERGGKKVAIKEKRPESDAIGRLEIEADWLKKLNKHGIGPKFIAFEDGKLVREFIDGEMIGDFVDNHQEGQIRKVFLDVLEQCHKMDEIGVNKEEMHHPVKHIIVREEKPIMIDFERCHATEKPKNVTQFIQFITSSALGERLRLKGIEVDAARMRSLANKYKDRLDNSTFEKIKQELE